MKRKYIKWIYFVALITGLQLTACTESYELLNQLEETKQTEDTDSRATEAVTAEVTLTEAGTLDSKLAEKLGDAKLTVQNLTISGPINATDVNTLHTLNALQVLDIANAKTMYDNEFPMYSFTYSYENSDGTTYEQNASGYLYDNEIGSYMFAGMSSLKEIKLPTNATRVSSNAFENCKALTTFNLPEKVSSLEWNTFNGCTSLTTFTYPVTLKTVNSAFSGSALTTLIVSEGVKVISGFDNCAMLKTVTLPSTLKKIGNSAFNECTSLESLTIPEGVIEIGSNAFSRTKFPSIELPSTLKEIGSYAFIGSALKEITIPSSVTTLGYGVFENCDQLKTLTIPETVTQVEGTLINHCDNISALFWNSKVDIDDIQYVNPNCYLYLTTSDNNAPAWGPNWVNVVIDGVAEKFELKYGLNNWSGTTYAFNCPKAFKAKKASISIDFNGQLTHLGVSSGWRTIVLPFTPTSISHPEKGELAPFGSDVPQAKPFWLRSLTKDGFADATSIEPNKPYIIAMPYNPDIYLDEYNIVGTVTFEGTDVEITETPKKLLASEGPDYYLQPTYKNLEAGSEVYVLNRDWWIYDNPPTGGSKTPGSIFSNTQGYSVYCFEAYVKPKPGATTRSVYTIDTRSVNTRSSSQKNDTGIPAIGDL